MTLKDLGIDKLSNIKHYLSYYEKDNIAELKALQDQVNLAFQELTRPFLEKTKDYIGKYFKADTVNRDVTIFIKITKIETPDIVSCENIVVHKGRSIRFDEECGGLVHFNNDGKLMSCSGHNGKEIECQPVEKDEFEKYKAWIL
jgi:hypothetical protein